MYFLHLKIHVHPCLLSNTLAFLTQTFRIMRNNGSGCARQEADCLQT